MTAGELDYATVFWFRELPDDTELAANDTMIFLILYHNLHVFM